MKKLVLLLFLLPSFNAISADTGYSEVTEVKVWKTYIDIYLTAENNCSQHRTRYILAKEEKEMYSTLLAAMIAKMVANINYNCRNDGLAQINGIRVKPEI